MSKSIEEKAIDLYKRNSDFLKIKNKKLFDKLKLFENAIELGSINVRYDLEYSNGYFDIYDNSNESWVYGTNSNEYSANVVKNINFKVHENSFKTFYDFKYEDGVAENSNKLTILSGSVYGNAPIVDYVNKCLPKDEIVKNMFSYIIFGVGLGIHLPMIDKIVNAKLYFIVEPSLELFRLSLFVTDYSLFAKNSHLFIFNWRR